MHSITWEQGMYCAVLPPAFINSFIVTVFAATTAINRRHFNFWLIEYSIFHMSVTSVRQFYSFVSDLESLQLFLFRLSMSVVQSLVLPNASTASSSAEDCIYIYIFLCMCKLMLLWSRNHREFTLNSSLTYDCWRCTKHSVKQSPHALITHILFSHSIHRV